MSLTTGLVFAELAEIDPARQGEPQFAAARASEARGDLGEAITAYLNLARKFPGGTFSAQAFYRAGQLYNLRKDYVNAFASFQELIESGREGDLFLPALRQQFEIAEEILERYDREKARRTAGVKVPPPKEAAEMLKLILASARQTAFAPRAMFLLSAAQARLGEAEESRTLLHTFLEEYPQDALTDDVHFQIAYADYQAGIEGRGNSEYLDRANDGLLYFIMTQPRSDRAPLARHLLEDIDQRRFSGLLEAGMYYDKTGAKEAARKVCRDLLARFPGRATKSPQFERIQELAGKDAVMPVIQEGAEGMEPGGSAPTKPEGGTTAKPEAQP